MGRLFQKEIKIGGKKNIKSSFPCLARTLFCCFIIFVLSFLFFFFVIQPFNTFPDPDSFYHAKIGEMIKDGVVDDFPWLQFTGLKDYFTDHHLLYHIFLIPFIILFGTLFGAKIASVSFAALLVAVVYWFLRSFKIRGALIYILILLSTYPFLFRINLAKSGVLAIIILVLALYVLFKNKPIWLFALSFLYVWTHGSWPVVLGLVVFYCFSSFLVNRKLNLRLFFYCLLGLVAGLIINPYFPDNLIFYWLQTVKIGFLNYQSQISVGAEWYAPTFNELFTGASLVFVLFFVALVGFVFSATKTKHLELRNTSKDVIPAKAGIHIVRILTLILIAGSFFVLTIKSARNVEYFVPLMVIFSAFVLNFVFNREENLAKVFKERMLKKKFINFLVLLYFLFALPYISFLGIKTARGFFEDGFDFNHFSSAAKAIEKESKPEEIVFHSSWDEFPFLFYNNTKNYYIVGLDPTFFYLYNQELYEKWEDIRHGKQKENLYKIIKDEFNASWVFVDKKYKDFEKNIKSDERFIKIYEDEESSVYKTE